MSDSISLLYFASLGDQLQTTEERYALSGPVTIAQLKLALADRGDRWCVFTESANLKCAVNQELAGDATEIRAGDEVAFFPPVTGG